MIANNWSQPSLFSLIATFIFNENPCCTNQLFFKFTAYFNEAYLRETKGILICQHDASLCN